MWWAACTTLPAPTSGSLDLGGEGRRSWGGGLRRSAEGLEGHPGQSCQELALEFSIRAGRAPCGIVWKTQPYR